MKTLLLQKNSDLYPSMQKQKLRLIKFAAIAAFCVLVSLSKPSQALAVTYDLTADFASANTSGSPWSFRTTLGPLATYRQFEWGGYGWGNFASGDGSVLNTSPAGLDVTPHDWITGDVMVHPLSRPHPYNGYIYFLSVVWTSPIDGTIDISGAAWDGAFFGDRDAAWELTVDGQLFAQRNSVQDLFRNSASAQFSNNLVPGFVLSDVYVHSGSEVSITFMTPTEYNHFVGLDFAINQTVPDSGSIGILASIAFLATIVFARKTNGIKSMA